VAKGGAGTDSDPGPGGTTVETATETGGETATGESTTGPVATTGETTTTTGGETTTTTGGATASATVGATETEGESETGEPPAECSEPDLAASAAFQLEFMGWENPGLSADVLCVVDAVTEMANVVTTTMTCDVDGMSAPASLGIAAAPEGEVDWAAGAEVRLVITKNFDLASQQIVQLRAAADDAILVVAVAGGMDNNAGYPEAFLPLIYDYSEPCGRGESETGWPAQIDIDDPERGEIHLISWHRGSLPIDDTHVYAIDVGEVVVGDSNHYPVSQDVLLRRVVTGG
jgi:hypothetical protein